MLGDIGESQFVDVIGGGVLLDEIVVDCWAGAFAVLPSCHPDRGEPLVVSVDLPCGAITHVLVCSRGLVGQDVGAELGVIPVCIMQGVCAVGPLLLRLGQIRCSAAQDLILLFKQDDPLTGRAQLDSLLPGQLPSSMPAWRIHSCNVISWTPKSFAIVTPSSQDRATRTTSSRNSRG